MPFDYALSAVWLSILFSAMIAVSRCISLTKPDLGEKLFSGRNGKLIILSVWIYANILVIPYYLGVSLFIDYYVIYR